MSSKFLLISQVFYPDQVSTGNLFTNLCSVLANDKIEVEVWSAQPSYTETKRQPSSIIYSGIKILVLPSTNFRKSSLVGRQINVLTFTISVSFKLLFSRDKTPVWTHTTPPFLGIIISFICSIKKRKFVYILLDIFPEGLIRLGMLSKNNPFVWIWSRLFLKSLKLSDKIIAIGRDMEKWVHDSCGECFKTIEYIPLWQDEKMIFPVEFDINEFVNSQQIKDKFIVQYSGNMGLWNEVSILGKAVMYGIENVMFIFIGGGRRKDELLKEINPDNQSNLILMPFQPNETFNTMLTASHVHIVTLKDSLAGIAVPSKIYGILASGIPVIAMVPSNSEIACIVREENCGFVISPEDTDGLVKAILKLKSDESLRKQMGINSRNAFLNKYTTTIIAGRYKELLRKMD